MEIVISERIMKNEMIAMILAGGQGSRLGKLTKETAKPAIPFGGRYRIIDFALSNCANSGVKTVGVITQYQPLELNTHVGSGTSWGLSGKNSGATILQPYSSADGEKWFEGTSHAIYQNSAFIDSYNPEYVLILSGDHIYKMDYEQMLEFHKMKNASLTVAVIKVPLEEASRFGIMNTDETNRIIEFQEKPKEPKSNLASMGIYIFTWQALRTYLHNSYATDGALEDFGRDVIPTYLTNGENVFAYAFDGYWKDVGTIDSLWEANMDLVSPDNTLNISDREWRIYSKNMDLPPHVLTDKANVRDALIVDGCYIAGNVNHSILSQNVKVGIGSSIKDSLIMANVKIGKNVTIDRAIIGEQAVIADNAKVIGTDEIAVVGYGDIVGGLISEEE